jgi:hypothetical protein
MLKKYHLLNACFYHQSDLIGLPISKVQLGFIDGSRIGRAKSAQYCLDNKVPIVILHDANKWLLHHYGYDSLLLPPGYRAINFRCLEGAGRETMVIWKGEERVWTWEVLNHEVVQ